MKTHYLVVKVEAADATKASALRDEILSNLESVANDDPTHIGGNIVVQPLKDFGEDLQTLQRATVDSRTEPVDITAALNNFVSDLLERLDIARPLDYATGDTDLSKFIYSK